MDLPNDHSPLGKETILKALALLNEKLREEGIVGEICLFGGTAMVLAFNARLSTQDVDAVFEPPEVFRRRAREIAEEINLPADWLNDGVKGYVSAVPEYTTDGLPEMPHLRIIRPTAEYLLAMKCMASRFASYSTKGDRDDVAFLLNHLRLTDAESVLKIVERFYPPERILPKTQFLIHELLQRNASLPASPEGFTHITPDP